MSQTFYRGYCDQKYRILQQLNNLFWIKLPYTLNKNWKGAWNFLPVLY